jgi:hypothetical protein
MKIKWNWGTGIFLAGSVFMLMIIVFVYFMFKQNFDLVEKDYYPKSLEFQQKVDKTRNSAELHEKVKVNVSGSDINFVFPSSFKANELKGTIFFYRPSEKKRDFSIAINADTAGNMFFDLDKLYKGYYIIKIDYTYQDKGFYQEESLVVP